MINFPKWITVPIKAFVALPEWVILASVFIFGFLIGGLLALL